MNDIGGIFLDESRFIDRHNISLFIGRTEDVDDVVIELNDRQRLRWMRLMLHNLKIERRVDIIENVRLKDVLKIIVQR